MAGHCWWREGKLWQALWVEGEVRMAGTVGTGRARDGRHCWWREGK